MHNVFKMNPRSSNTAYMIYQNNFPCNTSHTSFITRACSKDGNKNEIGNQKLFSKACSRSNSLSHDYFRVKYNACTMHVCNYSNLTSDFVSNFFL